MPRKRNKTPKLAICVSMSMAALNALDDAVEIAPGISGRGDYVEYLLGIEAKKKSDGFDINVELADQYCQMFGIGGLSESGVTTIDGEKLPDDIAKIHLKTFNFIKSTKLS